MKQTFFILFFILNSILVQSHTCTISIFNDKCHPIKQIKRRDLLKADTVIIWSFLSNPIIQTKLSDIFQRLKKAKRLKYLELNFDTDREDIYDIPQNLSSLKTLTSLNIIGHIKNLPQLNNIENLKILKVGFIDSISCNYTFNDNLEKLTLGYIPVFYNSICNISKLKYLKLSGCVTKIPNEINKLKQLDTLILSGTDIVLIPASIADIKSLKFLNLFDTFFNPDKQPNFIENLNCKLIWGTLCLNDRNTKLNNIFSLKELLSIDSITCDNKNLKFIESCVCIAGHDVWKYSKNKLLSTEQRDILNYYCKGFEKFKNNYKVRLYINIDLEDNNRQKYSVENRIILKE